MSYERCSMSAIAEREEEESLNSYVGRRIMRRVARRYGYTQPSWATSGFVLGEREYRQALVSDDIPTEPRYVMEPLVPKEPAREVTRAVEIEEEAEDASWLNDVAPQSPAPIRKEQLSADHLLTCWL